MICVGTNIRQPLHCLHRSLFVDDCKIRWQNCLCMLKWLSYAGVQIIKLVSIQWHQGYINQTNMRVKWTFLLNGLHERKYLCWDLLKAWWAQSESGCPLQSPSLIPLQSFPLGFGHCEASSLDWDTPESSHPVVDWRQLQLLCRLSVKEHTYGNVSNSLGVQ